MSTPTISKEEKNIGPCDLTSDPTSTELETTLGAQTHNKPMLPLCTSSPKTVQYIPEMQGENSVSVTSCPSPPSNITSRKPAGKKKEPEMFKHICDLIRYVAPNSVYNRKYSISSSKQGPEIMNQKNWNDTSQCCLWSPYFQCEQASQLENREYPQHCENETCEPGASMKTRIVKIEDKLDMLMWTLVQNNRRWTCLEEELPFFPHFPVPYKHR